MIYLAVFIGSLVFTGLVRVYAIRKSIVDIPNDRSSHCIPTPRGGGLAIAIAWFGGLGFYFVQNNMVPSLFYALLAGLPLSFIGFADDVFNLKPGVRFLIQFICAGVALWFLGGLQNIPITTFNLQLIY
jgi:Fuc2NAc and GlcNAc transferase